MLRLCVVPVVPFSGDRRIDLRTVSGRGSSNIERAVPTNDVLCILVHVPFGIPEDERAWLKSSRRSCVLIYFDSAPFVHRIVPYG